MPEFAEGSQKAQLIRVNERVFCATKYALGNVLYVLTGKSVVVIDTTESMSAAHASFEDFRNICTLPVHYIIYTHFHGDHIRGAKVFHTPTTQVIAQRRLPEQLASMHRVGTYRRRVSALQFGFNLKAQERGATALSDPKGGYVPPDVLFAEEYKFHEGDLSFELYHTKGESVDHVMIWIPEIHTLFPGDLYYNSFPMLCNPMKPVRPVLAWAESLDRMRALQPLHLVPSHGKPLRGAQEIDTVLANYARAIRYVHDETVKQINQGKSLDEIRRQVMLPQDLSCLPYLKERYGTVAWSVTGIYSQYTGWYSFNPVDLNPGPRAPLHRALLDVSGGPAPILERARRALWEDQNQLALELSNIVLTARPQNWRARRINLEALRRLADSSENGVARNLYRSAAREVAAGPDPFRPTAGGPRRLKYSGVWIRPASEPPNRQEQSHTPVSPARSELFRTALAPQAEQQRTAEAVNRWYDRRMYEDWARTFHEGSDFHNYGYWTPDTYTLKQASENLMEVLLGFIPRKAGTILDVACGKGATTRYLLRYYKPFEVMGINISEKQLRTCRRNAPGCHFFLMNASELGFANDQFDNIVCVESVFHFASRQRFLEEAYRVIKPGGMLVLSDILRYARRGTSGSLAPDRQVFEPSEYRDLYFQAGFERVEIIDATFECNTGLRRHRLRLLGDKWRRQEVDDSTFWQRREKIMRNEREFGYYLLACAEKGAAR